jgi:hypothetical protein
MEGFYGFLYISFYLKCTYPAVPFFKPACAAYFLLAATIFLGAEAGGFCDCVL